MAPEEAGRIEESLKQKVSEVRLLSHGLAPIWRATAGGRPLIIKGLEMHDQALCEIDGLNALEEAGFPVPKNRAVIAGDRQHYLVMEWIESGRATPRQIGSILVGGYKRKADRWGYNRSNYIGLLPQDNRWEADFASFYRECRLQPQFRRGEQSGLLSGKDQELAESALRSVARDFETLSPVLIHGDLWSGNLLLSTGKVYLIDPAVSYCHPEQDLAMMALFGGPLSLSDLESIALETGSPPGFRRRIPFWQIYPLLVHVNLFGASYLGQLRAALAAAN
ncbi:MAG: fructosamine kinase family protein [Spirochaetales bacterium]|nr:fructosamine kinase family protein [Spirochaetales bacterium]